MTQKLAETTGELTRLQEVSSHQAPTVGLQEAPGAGLQEERNADEAREAQEAREARDAHVSNGSQGVGTVHQLTRWFDSSG